MARKLSKSKLKSQLKASEPDLLPDKFVAAAVQIGANGKIHHAAIAIGSEYGKHIFGYNSVRIEQADMEYSRMYYQKSFENIPPHLAEAFYVHCSAAAKISAPKYGYFYNGTYFKDGKLINIDECSPYRMTCVGFCLAILQGWHTEDGAFINYEDWNEDNSMSEIEAIVELKNLKELYNYLDENELRSGMRRIKPSEYLSSAFLEELPMQKALIEPIAKSLAEIATEIALENKAIENN
jgi:hypothetical protein